MEATAHFLNGIFSPENFAPEDLDRIKTHFRRVTYSKNDYLLQEGDIEKKYWFCESGFLRSFVSDPEGNDITTNFYTKGEIVIDWTSFFLRTPSRENIQALTDCVCWQLDYESFQQLFNSIQSFREQGRTNLVNSYFSLKRHHISMIADQAKERYLQLMKEKPHVVQNISLKHIATYLGITDTSLSRIRKEISEE